MAKLSIAVQLYTLRDQTAADMPGTLKRLREIGYTAVETAGYGNLKSAKEMAAAVKDAGLRISSAHVGIEGLEKNLNGSLDEQAELGNAHVVVPYIGDDRRSADGYRKLADSMNTIGAECRKRAMTLAYHNHDFEFKKYDDVMGLEIVWQHADPKLVLCELDVYWAARAGVDPAAYIRELGERMQFLHLKDMNKTDPTKFAPVGTGKLDFPAIAKAAAASKVLAGIVEQDDSYDLTPWQSVETSLNNLRALGIA